MLRAMSVRGHRALVIAANSDVGVLYGAFALLRLIADAPARSTRWRSLERRACATACSITGTTSTAPSSAATPAARSGTGRSCPTTSTRATRDYARANASIGINGSGAQQRQRQRHEPHRRVPREGGGARRRLPALRHPRLPDGALQRADRDRRPARPPTRSTPRCAAWWRARPTRSTASIPDFGGFLVKANSEGQPGPQDYGRTHADGANMLADALAPHGGIVMWRAFVYSSDDARRPRQAGLRRVQAARRHVPRQRDGAGEERPDRLPAARAVPSAVRRDAEDAAHAGAADHQGVPRLRDAPRLPRRRCSRRCCGADTYAQGQGSTVAQGHRRQRRIGYALTGIAGVSPTSAPTATGAARVFDQANWYAFGRLAWDPTLGARRHRRRVDAA